MGRAAAVTAPSRRGGGLSLPFVLLSALLLQHAVAPALGQQPNATASSPPTSPTAASGSAPPPCASGVHVFVARGSDETNATAGSGTQLLQLAGAITSRIPNSTVESVAYPAAGGQGLAAAASVAASPGPDPAAAMAGLAANPDVITYANSEKDGVFALAAQLSGYVGRCPTSWLVMLGFEQGAQVTADVLCGTSETTFNYVPFTQPAAAPGLVKNLVAIILLSDPSHAANLTWDFGTSVRDGVFPRTDDVSCVPFVMSMRSYCDTGDPNCDLGTNHNITGRYYSTYGIEAVQFVVDQWNASIIAAMPTPSPNPNGAWRVGGGTWNKGWYWGWGIVLGSAAFVGLVGGI